MPKTAHTEAAEPTGWCANYIEETIRSVARLHAEHHENATPLQRAVDRITALLGRTRFIGVLTVIAASWISLNLLAAALGYLKVRDITSNAMVHPSVKERFDLPCVVQCAGSGPYRPKALIGHNDFKEYYASAPEFHQR